MVKSQVNYSVSSYLHVSFVMQASVEWCRVMLDGVGWCGMVCNDVKWCGIVLDGCANS